VIRVLGSLTNRIFLASTLLATLSIGAAVYFVSARMTRETEDEIQRDLTEAATLVDEQRRTQFDNVTRLTRLIADLPKFKAVVELGDQPTLLPIAADYQNQIGADLLIVSGRRGEILAISGDAGSGGFQSSREPLRVDAPASPVFWEHPRGVLQIVSVPITLGLDRPDVLGVLSVGYLFDDRRAAQFKALTGADIAFAMGGIVRASTLDPGAATVLQDILHAPRSPRIVIGDAEYVALTQPLSSIPSTDPTAIILRSRTDRMRTLASIQAALAGIALGAVLLAGVVSYLVARTITRPLATITDHMRLVAKTGDLTSKIATKGPAIWHDEDALMVATTFNTLTDSIAMFQREAGQRERLSSLGRLSTVIAHEVRNPLMIIKGALRTMAKPGANEADVRDAANDIDQETDRLNRLVTDVLDVARPIHVEPAPTDMNAVCRDAAAAAAAADGTRPQVSLELAKTLPTIVTDGERLRTVLVNLLTNAQHAADNPGSVQPAVINGQRPSVSIITERLSDRRVAITVRDRGMGIADDDLARIFEPYFTTRRAGTGLGLAISKNIIDALGGTIGVVSKRGVGTDFRVELGDAPGTSL
jgi:signal transduction histidine kinase